MSKIEQIDEIISLARDGDPNDQLAEKLPKLLAETHSQDIAIPALWAMHSGMAGNRQEAEAFHDYVLGDECPATIYRTSKDSWSVEVFWVDGADAGEADGKTMGEAWVIAVLTAFRQDLVAG